MGPFKCPDCGVWWAGFEHRCAPTKTWTGATPSPRRPWWINTVTVRCTCPEKGGGSLGNCPVHDVQVTYTGGG